jgi:hypothetical protein
MILIHFGPKQLCLGGIKFVNSHRILGIVVGGNGRLPAITRNCCKSCGDN